MQINLSKTLPAAELIKYAAQKRWERETAGIDVGGFQIDTTRDSQDMVQKAMTYLQNAGPGATVQFKAMNGWMTLDLDHIRDIGLVIGHHIQWCFGLEREAQGKIATGLIKTASEIDQWFAQSELSSSNGQPSA